MYIFGGINGLEGLNMYLNDTHVLNVELMAWFQVKSARKVIIHGNISLFFS